jgi:uncharacterized membrane protein
MTVYNLVLIAKLLSVLSYAGGLIAAFVAQEPAERRLAVHSIASTGLLATWSTGIALAWLSGVKLFELWIVVSFALSLISQLALVYSVLKQDRSATAFTRCALPLGLIIGLMVVKPTWSTFIQ